MASVGKYPIASLSGIRFTASTSLSIWDFAAPACAECGANKEIICQGEILRKRNLRILELYRDNGKKMETTIADWGNIEIAKRKLTL